jgi:S-formylglutathione hydrolase FrmB
VVFCRWLAIVMLVLGFGEPLFAQGVLDSTRYPILSSPFDFLAYNRLERMNKKLHGKIQDFTHNHGKDQRIFSPCLGVKRDLYVYLPPGYDATERYPLIIFLHGINQDEKAFMDYVELFDKAISCGEHPPAIIAIPDGSIAHQHTLYPRGSFYINSVSGRYSDWISCDVWNFMVQNYRIRPEREAHALMGGSMGGFGSYNIAIKHRDRFGMAVGIFPPLNLRYSDASGGYFTDFDPGNFAYREQYQPFHPIARYYGGLVTIRQYQLIKPIYGSILFSDLSSVVSDLSRDNPIEMLESYNLKPGELELWVGYGRKDQFNIDAQIESFLYVAKQRNIDVTTVVVPEGDHSTETGVKLIPVALKWSSSRLAPYAPPCRAVKLK